MVDRMVADGDEVPVSTIAKAAGVSVRTVYVHFPDNQSRVSAISEWLDARTNFEGVLPESFEDLPDYSARLVDHLFANETLIRAQMVPGLSQMVRRYRKQPHLKRIAKILKDQGWSKARSVQTAAYLVATLRAEAIFDLHTNYGFSPKQIARMFKHSTQALLAVDEKTTAP